MIKKTLLSILLVMSCLSISTKTYAQETYYEDEMVIVVNSNELGTGYFLSREDIELENYTEYLALTTYEEKRDFFHNVFFVEWNNLNPREHLDYEMFFLDFLCEELKIVERPQLDSYSMGNGIQGYYSFKANIVHLNQFHCYDGITVFTTLCHETRHAWQRQEIFKQTAWGQIFLDNLNNYYYPYEDVTLEEYMQKNMTEADAFVYQHNKLMEYLNR